MDGGPKCGRVSDPSCSGRPTAVCEEMWRAALRRHARCDSPSAAAEVARSCGAATASACARRHCLWAIVSPRESRLSKRGAHERDNGHQHQLACIPAHIVCNLLCVRLSDALGDVVLLYLELLLLCFVLICCAVLCRAVLSFLVFGT